MTRNDLILIGVLMIFSMFISAANFAAGREVRIGKCRDARRALKIFFYLPILGTCGILVGALIGLLAKEILRLLRRAQLSKNFV